MSAYEYLLKAERISDYRKGIDEESEAILVAANKVTTMVGSVVNEMIEGVNAKLSCELSESIYTICDLPEPDDAATMVIGADGDDIDIEFRDKDGDLYQISLNVEILVDETMRSRLQQIVAGMLVSYLNKEEPMAIERLHRERALLKSLKHDLESVETQSTRIAIEDNISQAKSVIKSTNLFLKDIGLIKQRLLD